MRASDIATLILWVIIVTGVVTCLLAASYKQKGKEIDRDFFILIPCVMIVTLVVVSLFTRAELSLQEDAERQREWNQVSNLRFLELFRFRPYTRSEVTGYRNPYFVSGQSQDESNRSQSDAPPSYMEAVRTEVPQDILQPHQVIPGRPARVAFGEIPISSKSIQKHSSKSILGDVTKGIPNSSGNGTFWN